MDETNVGVETVNMPYRLGSRQGLDFTYVSVVPVVGAGKHRLDCYPRMPLSGALNASKFALCFRAQRFVMPYNPLQSGSPFT